MMPTRPAATREKGLLGEQDLYLFNQGTHDRVYRRLGSHLATQEGRGGAAG